MILYAIRNILNPCHLLNIQATYLTFSVIPALQVGRDICDPQNPGAFVRNIFRRKSEGRGDRFNRCLCGFWEENPSSILIENRDGRL